MIMHPKIIIIWGCTLVCNGRILYDYCFVVTKLGVSLGSSPSQVLESVNTLKEVDLQRILVMLKIMKKE
jgi:hypothetical protein